VAFRCGVSGNAPCACAAIPCDAGTLARLRETYAGCLCGACLLSEAAGGRADAAAQTSESPGRERPTEG
jgi:hypothetical protein